MNRTIKEIARESVSTFRFPNKEALSSKEIKKYRSIYLTDTCFLKNIDPANTKIVFRNNVDLKKVNTTVCAQTEKYSFRLIPLN